MRRSSIFLLLGAVLLGLLAVFVARSFLGPQPGEGRGAQQHALVTAVVVARPMVFGDVVTPDKLKTINLPGALPGGGYPTIRDAVGDGNRTALRCATSGSMNCCWRRRSPAAKGGWHPPHCWSRTCARLRFR